MLVHPIETVYFSVLSIENIFGTTSRYSTSVIVLLVVFFIDIFARIRSSG